MRVRSIHFTPRKRAGLCLVIMPDHIMIRTGDPRELYAFFGGDVAAAGRVADDEPARGWPRLLGVAFEPSALDESLVELNRRGLGSGERRPLVATGPDGSKRTLRTNVTLRQFSDSDSPADATIHIFLSEYSPTYVNVDERRARLRAQLVNSGGGPLGVVDVKEVIIGAVDVDGAPLVAEIIGSNAFCHVEHVGDWHWPCRSPRARNENRVQTLRIAATAHLIASNSTTARCCSPCGDVEFPVSYRS